MKPAIGAAIAIARETGLLFGEGATDCCGTMY